VDALAVALTGPREIARHMVEYLHNMKPESPKAETAKAH
jgi:hypothetical protein